MQRRHETTLAQIFARPVSGSIRWKDIEALFVALGATVREREGSRVSVVLFGEARVFHRPHPKPETKKGAVEAVRQLRNEAGQRQVKDAGLAFVHGDGGILSAHCSLVLGGH